MRRNQNRLVVGGSSSVVEKHTQTDWTELTEPISLGAYMKRHVRHFPYTLSKSLAVNLTQFIERREYYASQLSGELLSVREYYAAQLDQTPARRASTQLIARPILVYPERLEREWAGDVEYEHTIDVPRWITENVVRELRQSIDDVAEIWVDFQLGDLRNWSGRGLVHRFHHKPIYPIITIVTHDRCFAQLCYSGFYITIETTAFYGIYRHICHTGEYPDIRSMHRMHSADDALIVRTSGDMHIYQRLGMMDDDEETISFGREVAQTGNLSDRTAPMAHFWAQVDDGPHVATNQRTLNSSNSESIPPQRKGYDVVQWRNPDGTRSPLPFKKLHIQNELFLTTILLNFAFTCNDVPTIEFYGSYGFILGLITRLDKQNAMVEAKRRAIVKASAVERMRSSADGREGSMVWSDTMGRLYGTSHRQPFPNYDACMTSTDYPSSEQLYHLANGMELNPPRGKRGDPEWRRALCRLLTGASPGQT
jgi:hypothetical protein